MHYARLQAGEGNIYRVRYPRLPSAARRRFRAPWRWKLPVLWYRKERWTRHSSRDETIASGSKLGIDATKKLPGEAFKRRWPPLIKMDAAVKTKVEKLFDG
jgi:hypothetical protein